MITLIVPTYSDEPGLLASLDSVQPQLAQSGIKLIVIDDCGSPLSEATIQRIEQIGRFIRLTENQGPAGARNAGANVADTAWITYLDCGDLWLSGRGEQLTAVARQAAPEQMFTWNALREKDGQWTHHFQYIGAQDLNEQCRGCRFQPGSTLLINRQTLVELGGYDANLRRLEDWALFVALVAQGAGHTHLAGGKIAVTQAGGGSTANIGLAIDYLFQLLTVNPWNLSAQQIRLARAYLWLERAAVHKRQGGALNLLRFLTSLGRSFAALPRLRLHTQQADQIALTNDDRRNLHALGLLTRQQADGR